LARLATAAASASSATGPTDGPIAYVGGLFLELEIVFVEHNQTSKKGF
jgi:hypothetical protein